MPHSSLELYPTTDYDLVAYFFTHAKRDWLPEYDTVALNEDGKPCVWFYFADPEHKAQLENEWLHSRERDWAKERNDVQKQVRKLINAYKEGK